MYLTSEIKTALRKKRGVLDLTKVKLPISLVLIVLLMDVLKAQHVMRKYVRVHTNALPSGSLRTIKKRTAQYVEIENNEVSR